MPVTNAPYRIVRPAWYLFNSNLDSPLEPSLEFDDLELRLKRYAEAHQLQVQWDVLKKLSSAELIDFVAVQLPFEAAGKQALVEAKDVAMRAETLCKAHGSRRREGRDCEPYPALRITDALVREGERFEPLQTASPHWTMLDKGNAGSISEA